MVNKLLVFTLFTVLLFHYGSCNGDETLKIGALFDKPDPMKEKAFSLAIDEINKRRFSGEYEVEAVIEYVPPDNPFQALKSTCKLIEEGVVAILGPSTEDNSNVVQSVCDDKDIPHLDVRWDDQPLTPIINVYPYQGMLTQVYVDIINAWNYKDFVILYENNESLQRVGELLKIFTKERYKIVVRQLDKHQSGSYIPVLKDVWRSGATHFILDCSIEILKKVLTEAQQVGLMTSKESYIITNLDFHTLDLTPFQYAETNITGMRFIDPESEAIQNIAFDLFKSEEMADLNFRFLASWKLQLETALITDVIMMFGEALRDLPKNFAPPSLNCSSNEMWTFGTTLTNLMKGIRYPGLTGHIKFDNMGFRTDFGLEIIELKEGGVTRVGNWTTSTGLNISRIYPPVPPAEEGTLVNRTFIVITALTEPYGMRKESSVPLYGNDRYEGFGVDLIHELSQMLGFNYTFIIREDKKNGEYDEATNEWTGMIGDVRNGKADLAITDLTITYERETAVDFTSTFMNLGISILFQKAKKAPPSFFSFAAPFALDIWKLLAATFFGVSIALFIMGRVSPGEWQNPYPCIEEPEFLVNQLSFRNCLWFMTGSIMLQGSEIAPLAYSTRMVAGMWWFFTLIISSTYTANLAACLTTESPDAMFEDVFELVRVAEDKGIKYGAKINGSTANFFRDSKHIEAYQKIYEYMKANEDEVMVRDNKIGVMKADTENYAFFMESTSIEYETQRKCNLTSVGRLLDEKGYGIAMRKNSTYRGILSTAILKMQEDGVMADLKRKWWEERRGGGQCAAEDENTEATPLNLKNVGGVFWVTIIGTMLSVLMSFFEMMIYLFKRSITQKISFRKMVVDELKFYLKFPEMVKPVHYEHTESDKSDSQSPKGSFDDDKQHPAPYGFIEEKPLTKKK